MEKTLIRSACLLIALAMTVFGAAPALADPSYVLTSYSRSGGQDGAADFWSGQFVDTASVRRAGDQVTVDRLVVVDPPQASGADTIAYYTATVTFGCAGRWMETRNLVGHRADGGALAPAADLEGRAPVPANVLQTFGLVCAGRFAPVTYPDIPGAVAYAHANYQAIQDGGDLLNETGFVRLGTETYFVGIHGPLRGRAITVWMLHVLAPSDPGSNGNIASVALATYDCDAASVTYYRWVLLATDGRVQESPMIGRARPVTSESGEHAALTLVCRPPGGAMTAFQGAVAAIAEVRGDDAARRPSIPPAAPVPAPPASP